MAEINWGRLLRLGLDVSDIKLSDGGFWSSWLGGASWTGKSVTVNGVLQLSTAWACVRLIAETMATMPCNVQRTKPDGSKVVDKDHQLQFLLNTQPNADQDAVLFWQVFFASLLLWGNAYVELKKSAGVVTSLIFLLPAHVVRRQLPSGEVEWRYSDPITRKVRVIPADRMWHMPAFSLDGISGLSPVRMGANVFGAAMASGQAASETFSRGMRANGIVTMDAVLSKPQRDGIREHVQQVSRDGGFFVLEKGAGFEQLTMNPQDAELLSTRHFDVEEICRWYGVWPVLVGHGDKASNWGTGYEQQMLAFVVFLLRRWAVRVEKSARKVLFSPAERLTHSLEFGLEALLRGDSAARSAFYSQMLQNGVYTRDEVRRLENLPLMGGNASVLTVQSNLVPIDQLGAGQSAAESARSAFLAWLDGPGFNSSKDDT